MSNRLCISTVVNRKYQKYIPMFSYFCLKSYPDYEIKLFLTETLDVKYRECVDILNNELGVVKIVENYDGNMPKSNQELKTFRWLFQSSVFEGYDYIYIGDIDIIICKETPFLLDQHLDHCVKNNLPYSNSVRPNSKRLSGLHFIKKGEYYNHMDPVIEKFRSLLKNGKLRGKKNEEILYSMVKESGLAFPKGWFRPHHGIHLGLWRNGPRSISEKAWDGLGKFDYSQYYKFYKDLKNDNLFKKLYNVDKLIEMPGMEQSFKKLILK